MNIVSTIMQYLTPMIINRLAGSLGLNEGIAGKAIAAAVPAILASLSGAASRGGAGQITQSLGRQDPGILGNLAGMLGGAGAKQFGQSGTDALSSLLGGSSTGALAGAIGKFAGIGNDQSRSLLGMVAPVVLGGLAKQTQGLDAKGVTNFLAGQQDNIAAAMPPGFSQLLSGAGLADRSPDSDNDARRVADRGRDSGGGRVSADTDDDGPHAAGMMGMGTLGWLLPLAALALLGWYFLSPRAQVAAPTTPTPAVVKEAVKDPAPKAVQAVPGVDFTKQLGGILDGLRGSLGGVTDEASAKTALPQLQDYAGQLEKFKGLAGSLPADARGPLATAAGGAMPGLASLIDKVSAIPGVGAILKPVLDAIVASMAALGKA